MDKQAQYDKNDLYSLKEFRDGLIEAKSERFKSMYRHIYCSPKIDRPISVFNMRELLRPAAIELSKIAIIKGITLKNVDAPEIRHIAQNIDDTLNEVYDAVLILKYMAPGGVEDKIIRSIIDYRPAFDDELDKSSREIVLIPESPKSLRIDLTGNLPNIWQMIFNLAQASEIKVLRTADKLTFSHMQTDNTLDEFGSTALTCGFERILAGVIAVERLSKEAQIQDICLEEHLDWILEEIDQWHQKDIQTFFKGTSILKFGYITRIIHKIKNKKKLH